MCLMYLEMKPGDPEKALNYHVGIEVEDPVLSEFAWQVRLIPKESWCTVGKAWC